MWPIKGCVNLTVCSFLTMVSLALLEDTGNGTVWRRHVFMDHTDLLVQDDDWLMSPFRMPKAIILELWAELGPALERKTARNHALSTPSEALTTLRFFATRAFQKEIAVQLDTCPSYH